MQQSLQTHRNSLIFLVCFFGLLLSVPAEAMRCGSKVIRAGDSAEKVRTNCGEPTRVERRSIYRTPFVNHSSGLHIGRATTSDGTSRNNRRASEEVWVEMWTYDFGKDKLMRTIRLDDGVVSDIATEGYGK